MKQFLSIALATFMSLNNVVYATETPPPPLIDSPSSCPVIVAEEKIVHNDYSALVEEVNVDVEDLISVIDGNKSGLQPYVRSIYEISVKYGVNPVFLVAQFGIESGWGTSELFLTKNNLAGWRSNDGSYKYFNKVEECIERVAENYANQYTNPEHWKYCGGDSIEQILSVYAPNNQHYIDLMYEIMESIYKDLA